MKTFVEPRPEHGFGRHEIDGFQSGQAREQAEIGNVQPVDIRNPVRHRDDDPANGVWSDVGDEPLTQQMLVERAAIADARLVLAKRVGEKQRLAPHAVRARVGLGGTERVEEEFLEARLLLTLPSQLIVEAKEFAHQSGPDLE